MLNKICFILLLFIIYSFIGWIIEVINAFYEKHKFVNRGFLIGPYCPIYGCGCLAIIFFLMRYKDDWLVLFIMSMVICSVLEYLTSYVMEKIFNTRWWDYSDKKFNLNGRICLDTLIPFGILGCLVVYIINPFFSNILLSIPSLILNLIAIILMVIFLTDYIISTKIIFGFRNIIKTTEKDVTEEITKKVKEQIKKKNVLYRRLIRAFPDIKNHKEYLLEFRKRVDNELKQLSKKKK